MHRLENSHVSPLGIDSDADAKRVLVLDNGSKSLKSETNGTRSHKHSSLALWHKLGRVDDKRDLVWDKGSIALVSKTDGYKDEYDIV